MNNHDELELGLELAPAPKLFDSRLAGRPIWRSEVWLAGVEVWGARCCGTKITW